MKEECLDNQLKVSMPLAKQHPAHPGLPGQLDPLDQMVAVDMQHQV